MAKNVLFIMVDEMSAWALDGRADMPNVQRLLDRGMCFDAAYTPSPICVPARASVATGKYVHEIGYWSSAQAYDGAVRSWAHELRDASHDVVSIGKPHYRNGTDDTGFAEQIEPIHIPGGQGWVRGLLRRPLCSYDATAEFAEDIGAGRTDYQDFDRRVATRACEWISADERREKRWCTFVSFLSPHYPLIAPGQDFDLYNPASLKSEAEPVPDHPILQELAVFFDHDPYFTPETRGIARAAYLGLCTFVDRQIGRVLDALDASGQTDETLIIFTSDHGEMLGEKGFWAKSTMYDSSARVPLIIAGPGVGVARRTEPVSLIDIAPTISNQFGIENRDYSGENLLSSPNPDRTVLSEYHDGGCSAGITMVRWNADRPWKLVHYAEGHPAQLFDLDNDPMEEQNLAEMHPQVVADGRLRLKHWMDAEAVNEQAHADQAAMVEKLGGRDALLAQEQWNYTPADSR